MIGRNGLVGLSAALTVGCGSPVIDAAFGGSDTVVVNGVDPAAITLEARDAATEESPLHGGKFAYLSGDRLGLSKDGIVECNRPGEMQFEVSVRGFSKRMTLLCRPIRGFANPRSVRLVAGGGGELLPINPLSQEGGLEEQFRAKITLADTTIATMRKGKVYPKKPGETYADAQVGDCVLRIGVVVIGRAATLEGIRPFETFTSDVVLAGADSTTWTLPVGRYRFYPRGSPVVSGTGLNCAAIPNGLSCVSKPGATLSLERERPGRGADTVHLVVERLGDEPSNVHSSAFHVSGRSRLNGRCVNHMGGFATR